MGSVSGKPWRRHERIGECDLYLGDCLEVMPELGRFDAVVTDPPFSARTHTGHDAGARQGRDKAKRERLGYDALSFDDVAAVSDAFCSACNGWIAWITDHTLAPHVCRALERNGRYVFAPLPFYQPGRSVRLTGDGPCSWTDWIVVARTAKQMRWGTLPGGYIAREGWKDKEHMGGKPLTLMMQIVDHYSKQGQTVLDPFLGSGTTLVACHHLGRRGTGIELDPDYFDIACRRIDEATRQPRLALDEPAPQPVQSSWLDDGQ